MCHRNKKKSKFVAIRCVLRSLKCSKIRGPRWGAYDALPGLLSAGEWGGVHRLPIPSHSTPSASRYRRLRRLDSCPPNEKIVPAPLARPQPFPSGQKYPVNMQKLRRGAFHPWTAISRTFVPEASGGKGVYPPTTMALSPYSHVSPSPFLPPPSPPANNFSIFGHCIRNFVQFMRVCCQSGITTAKKYINGVGKAHCMLTFLSGG